MAMGLHLPFLRMAMIAMITTITTTVPTTAGATMKTMLDEMTSLLALGPDTVAVNRIHYEAVRQFVTIICKMSEDLKRSFPFTPPFFFLTLSFFSCFLFEPYSQVLVA